MESYRRELNVNDLLRMNLPKRFWGATFDEISNGPGDDPEHRTLVANYLRKVDEMMSIGAGMFLWGPNGVGKTSIAAVIAKEVRRRGYSVLFVAASGLKRMSIEKEDFGDGQTVMDRARAVDLLIVDDLGKGVQDSTGFGARLLDELIRGRSSEKLAMIVTTNMNPRSQASSELKVSTMHSMKECMLPIKIEGEDRREDSKKELKQLLMG
jgi:DNA replication protein DnaC